MRRFRFRLRSLILAIAALAVALGLAVEAARLWQRSREFRARAIACRAEERIARSTGGGGLRAGYLAEMGSKYERASIHPWDEVEPDPPAPPYLDGPIPDAVIRARRAMGR